jgi:signal-transduction protein with cAMP-binding, CBS, and nucleotidyltransferase domain
MSSSVINVDSQTFVEEAAKLMSTKMVSSLLVKQCEAQVVIVTITDFVKKLIAEDQDQKTTNIGSVMSKPLFSLDEYIQRMNSMNSCPVNKIQHHSVTHGKTSGGDSDNQGHIGLRGVIS